MTNHHRIATAVGCLAAVAAAGTHVAVAADSATRIQVQAAPALSPGQVAPFDAAGVKAIRRGKPIPSGYSLIGQRVDITRGAKTAGAALTFQCPQAKSLRTFGVSGNVGVTATDRNYAGHRATTVVSSPAPHVQHATGTVYAVCR
jgi:hypothetical protein